jgi:hypothetical protein
VEHLDLTDDRNSTTCHHCGAVITGVPAQELLGHGHHLAGPTYRAFCTDEHYQAWCAASADKLG